MINVCNKKHLFPILHTIKLGENEGTVQMLWETFCQGDKIYCFL